MEKAILFDMDGTIANLYAVDNWLTKLRSYDPTPYRKAEPMVNMSRLAKYIHMAQASGWKVGIVSWLSKDPDPAYGERVKEAKTAWLKQHLPSVEFDTIRIVAYGTPKSECVAHADTAILFDDEERNRKEWKGLAYTENEIFKVMQILFKKSEYRA